MTGQEIRNWRESKDLSRRALAVMMGISEGTILRWEYGRCDPSLENLRKLKKLMARVTI